jgi:hypothetical protein
MAQGEESEGHSVKIHRQYGQGSEAWLWARAGIPTASEWDALVSPVKLEIRTGETPRTYLAQKVAERWYGPLPQPPVFAMEQGNIIEERARPWIEFQYGRPAEQVGFITDDAGRFGCSPDGWFEHECAGLEIKCPQIVTHTKYLLAGKLPDDYRLQVQGSMLVTGAPWWTFLSYHNAMPKLVLKIDRDEKTISVLREALDQFLDKLDAAFLRLVELNGGPPPKREMLEPSPTPMGLQDPDDFKM